MLLGAKRMAFLGLLLAFAVLLIVLSGIIEMNTLFLLAAAAYLVGVAVRESGLRLGAGFLLAAAVLGMLLAPNKIYCITFSAMGFYIFAAELVWNMLFGRGGGNQRKKTVLFWIMKYMVFNVIFIPMLFFLPELIYGGRMNGYVLAGFLFLGQIGILIFDKAYEYFQRVVWGRLRKHLIH